MTEPIGSFEMINVMEAKNSESVGENELIENTSQYRVITMGKLNRSTSGIWSYFGIAEKQNSNQPGDTNHKTNDRILCLLCFEKGVVHVYNRSTSSGNLWRHLHRKHSIPIPKDRVYRTAINVKNSFDCNDTKFIEHDEGTIFSRELDTYNISIDNDKLDIMTTETCKNQSTETFKDIGGMLIAEVAKRPGLYEWNPSFGKKIRRDTLWQEVYEALGKVVEVDRLQKMWKNIRDRYKKLRNFERHGLSDTSTRYKYYDQLRFLDYSEQQDSQDSKTFESAIENSLDFETLVDTTEEPPEKRLHTNDSEEDILQTFEEPKKESNTPPPSSPSTSAFINIALPLVKSCNSSNDAQPTSSTVSTTELMPQQQQAQLLPQQQQQPSYSDEFDLFGRFIAEKLRKLPTSRIDEVEIKILQVIRSEENQ